MAYPPDVRNRNILESALSLPQESEVNDVPLMQESGMVNGQIPSPDEGGGNINTILAMMGGQQKEDAMNALMEHLGQMPERTQPGMGRRILGGLASLSGRGLEGQRIADLVQNKPYYEKLGDWERKLKPLETTATIEGRRNNYARLAQSSQARADYLQKENERKTKEGQQKDERERENLRIRSDRAATYKWKTEHPNHQLKEENGLLWSYDPASEEVKPIINPDSGEQIKGNVISNLEKKHEFNMEEIGKKGEVAQTNIKTRGEESRKTKQVIPGKNTAPTRSTASTKPPSASDLLKRRQLRAAQMLDEHPEWKQHVDIDEKGNVSIKAPKTGYFGRGPDQKTYNDIAAYMKGGEASTGGGGKIIVKDPTGKEHPFDTQEQADEFKKRAGIK